MDIVFVLVEPAVPENIGASARALNTMGFRQLRLVSADKRRDLHLEKQARILAHGSREILDQAQQFPNLAEAVADRDFVIATSAKPRHQWREHFTPTELRPLLADKGETIARVAVVFGREESGLHTAELDCADVISSIPLHQPYPSLNLSQAVMLYAYELSALKTLGPKSTVTADAGQYRALKSKLGVVLPALSFVDDSKLYQWAMQRLAQLPGKDIGFLHALCDKLLARQRHDG